MTPRPSASPHEQQLRDAKARLLRASREMSPTKFVQKHPFISVGAAAAGSMLLTAFATTGTGKQTARTVAAVAGKPATKGLLDLASKLATIYLSSLATGAATGATRQQQASDAHAVA